jgi:plastocyanin
MPINFPNSPSINDTYSSAGTTWIWGGTTWNVITSNTTINIPAQNTFSRISVAGQNDLEADSVTDTLTVVAGSNITITTDTSQDSLTITSTATGGGESIPPSNSFTTISVAGQSDVVAETSTDTLTFIAGTGISLTTNSISDSITITNTSTAGSSFNTLSDTSSANLTVDKIYLPALTMLNVTNSGASAYRFDQYGTQNNPTVYAINGTTISFNLLAQGHPFLIQNGAGINYNTGLVHVATDGTVSTGSAAQGKDSGTLYWKIPTDISGGYRYQCSVHAPMVGSITIKNFATL